MNADGTLTPRELSRMFPQADSSRAYTASRLFPQDTLVSVGDMLRIVSYNEPAYLDSLWNSAQDNAAEHTDELARLLADNGLETVLHEVRGADITPSGRDKLEVYVYDFEVVGLHEPPHELPQVQSGEFNNWSIWGAALAIAGLGAIGGELLVRQVITGEPGKGVRMISNGVFWISLAVISVSVAVIVKSAKAAVP